MAKGLNTQNWFERNPQATQSDVGGSPDSRPDASDLRFLTLMPGEIPGTIASDVYVQDDSVDISVTPGAFEKDGLRFRPVTSAENDDYIRINADPTLNAQFGARRLNYYLNATAAARTAASSPLTLAPAVTVGEVPAGSTISSASAPLVAPQTHGVTVAPLRAPAIAPADEPAGRKARRRAAGGAGTTGTTATDIAPAAPAALVTGEAAAIAQIDPWYNPGMAEKSGIWERNTGRHDAMDGGKRTDYITERSKSPHLKDVSLAEIIKNDREQEMYFKVITDLDTDPQKKISAGIIEKLHNKDYNSFSEEHNDLLDQGISTLNRKRQQVVDVTRHITPEVLNLIGRHNKDVGQILRIAGPDKGRQLLTGRAMLELAVNDQAQFDQVVRGLKHIEKVTNSTKAKRLNEKIENRLAELGLNKDQLVAATHEGLSSIAEVHRNIRKETLGNSTGRMERLDKWWDTLYARSRLVSHVEAERKLLRQCNADITMIGDVLQSSITPQLRGDALAYAREQREIEQPRGIMNTLTQLTKALSEMGQNNVQERWTGYLQSYARDFLQKPVDGLEPEEIKKAKDAYTLEEQRRREGFASVANGMLARAFNSMFPEDKFMRNVASVTP